MINLDKKNPNSQPVTFSTILWKSTIMAMIFALPALGIFLGIYYTTGNLLVSVVLGFGVHFATLVFSNRISKWLVNFQN